jgi:hypothetical protein
MPIDAKGNDLNIGDEIVVRCKVTDVQKDHVLTTTVELPSREHWFEAKVTELAVQGPSSRSKNGAVFASGAVPAKPKTDAEIAMDAGIAKAKELRAKSKSAVAVN